MKDNWEPCPRCGSKKVQTRGKAYWIMLPFVSGGCLIWFGFLFWPLFIVAIVLIIASPFGALLPKINQCRECKYTWKVK